MKNAREVFSYYIISMINEDLGIVFFFSFLFLYFEAALAVAENVLEPKKGKGLKPCRNSIIGAFISFFENKHKASGGKGFSK